VPSQLTRSSLCGLSLSQHCQTANCAFSLCSVYPLLQIQLDKMLLNLSRTVATQSARTFAHTTWVSGPPRTRIPLWEKVCHGVLIAAGTLAGPMYILVNIENYKKRD